MTQIQSPRFLMPILVSSEVDEPDLCHQIGQALWSPWSIGFGHSYCVDTQGVHALPAASLAKRVAVVALAILLWPLTLLATVLGNFISGFSTTQRKAYEQIKNWNIGVTWENDRPEIKSDRLILRPIQAEDLPVYQALISNDHAMRYTEGYRSNLTEQFYDSLNQWDESPYSLLAVVERESGRVIGTAMLPAGDLLEGEQRGWAHLSVLIDPAYRNDRFDEERATEGRDHIGLEVTRMLVTYARSLQERGALVTMIQRREVGIVDNMRLYERIDQIHAPLTELRASVHRHDIAARRIGERMIREIGATLRPPSAERECFALVLNA